MGLMAEDSTLKKPSILLGCVQAFLLHYPVCLPWYKDGGGGIYLLQVDSSQWFESKDSLVPVEVGEAKGHQHSFRLWTSLRTIHKTILDGGHRPLSPILCIFFLLIFLNSPLENVTSQTPTLKFVIGKS